MVPGKYLDLGGRNGDPFTLAPRMTQLILSQQYIPCLKRLLEAQVPATAMQLASNGTQTVEPIWL